MGAALIASTAVVSIGGAGTPEAHAARAASYGVANYLVSFRGEQTTQWSYSGKPLIGGCGTQRLYAPAEGSGSQHITFQVAKPVKAFAYRSSGGATFYARFNAKTKSDLKGRYVVRNSQAVCSGFAP